MSHTCICLICTPDHYPDELGSERRTSDRHFAIRFADDWRIRTFQHGRYVRECFEAMAGIDGWAAVRTYDELGRVHYCSCSWWQLCSVVVRGDIQVVAVLGPRTQVD